MIHQHDYVPVRTAVRRRQEWLLSAIGGTTLIICWYLSAALDMSHGHEDIQHPPHASTSAFDAAFVAANSVEERDGTLDRCIDACSTQLAQTELLQTPL